MDPKFIIYASSLPHDFILSQLNPAYSCTVKPLTFVLSFNIVLQFTPSHISNGRFLSGYPTKTLYVTDFRYACHMHCPLFWRVKITLLLSVHFFAASWLSPLFGPNIFLGILPMSFLWPFLSVREQVSQPHKKGKQSYNFVYFNTHVGV
jgi:hypothetical protein